MINTFKFHEHVGENQIHEYLDNNFGEIAKSWFNFQIQWTHNAYQPFKDLEKYVIYCLTILVQIQLEY